MIYIIIPVFNRWKFTKSCLDSFEDQEFSDFKIVVVDHGSTDGTSAFIQELYRHVILLQGDESMWWAAATNLGVDFALKNNAKFILTLNNDLVVKSSYLKEMMEAYTVNPGTIIGSISVDINDEETIAYLGTKWNKYFASYDSPLSKSDLAYTELRKTTKYIKTDLLPGRGTFISKEVFDKIGLFDDVNFPHYMADEDFSYRASKEGFSLIVNVGSVVYSHVNETGLKKDNIKSILLYLKETFTSIRSPNNLSIRWHWSKNMKIPLAYFIIDAGRTFMSQLIFSIKSKYR